MQRFAHGGRDSLAPLHLLPGFGDQVKSKGGGESPAPCAVLAALQGILSIPCFYSEKRYLLTRALRVKIPAPQIWGTGNLSTRAAS